MLRRSAIATAGALLALALSVFSATRVSTADAAQPNAVAKTIAPMPSLAPLVKELRPAVVNIYTTQNAPRRQMRTGDDFFDFFFRGNPQFRQPQSRERQALGSGFLIGDSLALTNNHVVDGADSIKVKLADGREFDAKVVGRDPSTDVALLELSGEGARELRGVKLGDSDAIEVGDYVVAIGNPFGLSHTVTSGIVSAKERVIGAGPYDDFIQTDASINPGNSGGPLFNLSGEVVGINTAIVAQGQGIGFAVPVNLVSTLLPQLRENGRVSRGWLGVGIQELTPDLAKALGLKAGEGVLVADVFEGSPAAAAGIRREDVVREFNGRKVSTPNELSRAVASVKPGEKAKVRVLREGRERTFEVKLDQRDEGLASLEGGTGPQGAGRVGLVVREQAGAGLLIEQVAEGSAAERAGVRPGDVLLDLQREPMRSVQDVWRVSSKVKAGENVLFRVRRGDAALYLTARAAK